ncbi:hypothetical protein [Anditalea andensis]|uniref:Uncharacterized protein n=1 Tax=Anditalea andensis TaxID=1048983 RepID=A0A074LI57_9BACT|nr:hypothetical protein [Anditalea andensis]KEO73472.1 hypothetical protein EL17_11230 [Anditalea andensis]
MKILIATQNNVFQNQIVGGAETSLKLLGEHLVKEGHIVHYITINLSLQKVIKREFDFNGMNITVIVPSWTGRLALKCLFKLTRGKKLYNQYLYSCFKPAI